MGKIAEGQWPEDLAYRAGLDLGFLRFLGDFVMTAAIPPTTNVSKSISTFGSCGASGFLCARDSSSVFRLAIGSSPRDAEPTSSDITRAAIILPSTTMEAESLWKGRQSSRRGAALATFPVVAIARTYVTPKPAAVVYSSRIHQQVQERVLC